MQGVYLEGAASLAVTSINDATQLIAQGTQNRAVANTDMNAQSSRSHAILIVQLQRERVSSSQEAESRALIVSRLYLVDLAGSERVKKSHVYGRHVNELRAINLSLSALGNCISALSKTRQQSQRHVPYRDSKLTRLLQSSLGGNAKAYLIVTISPPSTEVSETLSTLQFGQRAMQVAVQAHINVLSVLDYKLLYEQTQQALDERQQQAQTLEQELAKHEVVKHDLETHVMNAHLRIQHLEFECQAAKWSAQEQERIKPTKGTEESPRSWEQERAVLLEQHERDLASIKQKCDQKVDTYRRLADDAQQEWHTVEDELATEKQQVLSTLQELKDCKARFLQLDQETTERIAELLQDDKDKERDFRDEKETMQARLQSQSKQIEVLVLQV